MDKSRLDGVRARPASTSSDSSSSSPLQDDPGWEIEKFNFPTDIVRAEETDDDTINALDPNLGSFIERGGKLIQYHGWSDPQISPASSVQYYQRVLERLGGPGKVQDSYRLFMAPGMGHCSGGEGPNRFDMLSAMEAWVEQGKAPASILASRPAEGGQQRTRPLCPFPQVASTRTGQHRRRGELAVRS